LRKKFSARLKIRVSAHIGKKIFNFGARDPSLGRFEAAAPPNSLATLALQRAFTSRQTARIACDLAILRFPTRVTPHETRAAPTQT